MDNAYQTLKKDFSHGTVNFNQLDFHQILQKRFPVKTRSSHIECEVSGALALTLRVSRIFGIAPLYLNKLQNGRWRVRLSSALWIVNIVLVTVISILLLLAMVIDSLATGSEAFLMKDLPSGLTLGSELAVGSIVTSCGVYFSKQWMTMMILTVRRVDKIKKLHNCGTTREWVKYAYLVLVAYFVLIVVASTLFVFNTSKSYDDAPQYRRMYNLLFLELVRTYLLQGHCMFVVLAINEALSSVNKVLSQVLNDTNEVIVNNTNVTGAVESIRRAYLSYCHISDQLHQFEESSGPLLFALIMFYFIRLVVASLRFVVAIKCPMPLGNFIVVLIQNTYLTMNMLFLIDPCYRTEKQAEKTRVLVSRLMSREWMSRGRVGAQLGLIHQQLTVSRLTITPLGMFTLNRELIVTILGSITTYLVIVVQFQGEKLCGNIFPQD